MRPPVRGKCAVRGIPGHGHIRPHGRDPAALTPQERLVELGAILATGYRRLRVSLAESRQSEALCDPTVDGNGAEPAEEVA